VFSWTLSQWQAALLFLPYPGRGLKKKINHKEYKKHNDRKTDVSFFVSLVFFVVKWNAAASKAYEPGTRHDYPAAIFQTAGSVPASRGGAVDRIVSQPTIVDVYNSVSPNWRLFYDRSKGFRYRRRKRGFFPGPG
jgi:hypothetical protein